MKLDRTTWSWTCDLFSGADLCFHNHQPHVSSLLRDNAGPLCLTVCLFTSQLLLPLIMPTHKGWPGWVDLGGWLHIKEIYLNCCQLLTSPNKEQLCYWNWCFTAEPCHYQRIYILPLLIYHFCCFCGKVSSNAEQNGVLKEKGCEAGKWTLPTLSMLRRKMLSWNYVSCEFG